jgi:hypothetical protein
MLLLLVSSAALWAQQVPASSNTDATRNNGFMVGSSHMKLSRQRD